MNRSRQFSPRQRGGSLASLVLLLFSLIAGSLEAATPGMGDGVRAQITPRHKAILAAGISARVQTISHREGEAFLKGEQLVQLDCALVEAQLARTLAELDTATHSLAAKQRLLELHSGNRLEVMLAQANHDKAAAEHEVTRITRSHCTITAPFNGRVAERAVQPNEWVQLGSPLLKIIGHQQLELEFIAPAHWLRWLQTGSRFHLHVEALGRDYPARMQRIGAQVDPVSQTIRLYGQLEGEHPELIPGMSGRVSMQPPPIKQP
jgi:membrane fusion protein (multidrug efflux system)